MGCAQSKTNQAKQQYKDMKAQYHEEKKVKWVNDITVDDKTFKTVDQWLELYDHQKKPQQEQNSITKQPSEALKKAKQKVAQSVEKKISKTISTNIIQSVIQFIAQGLEKISLLMIEQKQENISHFLNNMVAVMLTYKFQYKNMFKFQYLRGIAVERLIVSLILTYETQAQKLGKKIDEDTIIELTEQFSNQLVQEFERQKALILANYKQHSSLFAPSQFGIQEDQIDEGVQIIVQSMQSYGEKKFQGILDQAVEMIPMAIEMISQSQFIIDFINNRDRQSKDFFDTRDQIIYFTDEKYQIMHDKIENSVLLIVGKIGVKVETENENENNNENKNNVENSNELE